MKKLLVIDAALTTSKTYFVYDTVNINLNDMDSNFILPGETTTKAAYLEAAHKILEDQFAEADAYIFYLELIYTC